MRYDNPFDALNGLAMSVRRLQGAKLTVTRASSSLKKATEDLESEQAVFNQIREEVIRLCPEVLEGFQRETVAIVNGQVSVVSDEEA